MDNLFFIIPVSLVFTFVFVLFVLSRIAWAKLAAAYPAGEHIGGTRLGLISLAVNFLNYNNAFILIYNEEGMHLRPIFLIRLFHKPVFIPWKEIKVVNDKRVHFFPYVELVLGSPVVVKLGMRKKTFTRMENTFNYYANKR
ncbi:MAG TPA: hypothetical protein VLJ68_12585 [Chitinophagaceae bacterium]|nr:hypothetical protein [Chitinophagaceae bacterium]